MTKKSRSIFRQAISTLVTMHPEFYESMSAHVYRLLDYVDELEAKLEVEDETPTPYEPSTLEKGFLTLAAQMGTPEEITGIRKTPIETFKEAAAKRESGE